MKTKIAILIGMTVCAILLTSPVLASAGYSKIYGNANEDDVLDMRDVTYIKLVIFGKKPATDFADANNDGKVSMLDVGQAKLIILGKEKQLTLVDSADRIVTVPRPIERVVSLAPDATRIIIALGECDKLVARIASTWGDCICYRTPEDAPKCAAGVCGGRYIELPGVASYPTINEELLVSIKPDVVITFAQDIASANALQEKTDIPVVRFVAPGEGGTKYTFFENVYSQIGLIGTLLDREEEAEKLRAFVEEKLDKVRKVTSEVPDSDKPKVYIVSRSSGGSMQGGFTTTLPNFDPIDIAGGTNVADDAGEMAGDLSLQVSKEQVIKWNPDIILINRRSLTSPASVTIESVLSDPDLQTVNAIKSKNVYYGISPHCFGKPQDRILINTVYLAKLFYPEEFNDLNLEEEGNEIMKRFLGVDGLFSEYADYLVWMREWLDSQK
jgi:iron complex transport system substrate-binding protein